jgi:hypothetical protein
VQEGCKGSQQEGKVKNSNFPFKLVAEEYGGWPRLLHLVTYRPFGETGDTMNSAVLEVFPPLGVGFCEESRYKALSPGICIICEQDGKWSREGPNPAETDVYLYPTTLRDVTEIPDVLTPEHVGYPRRTNAFQSIELFRKFLTNQWEYLPGGKWFVYGSAQDQIITTYLHQAENMSVSLERYGKDVLGWLE